MASCSGHHDGFDDDRFQGVVSANFHCSICLNVLKDPKMCRRNQHLFCSSCIVRHLANSSTCPECSEELTVGTLSEAPRVLQNCLSELNISCDYADRGCRQYVQLGVLEAHVRECDYGPVPCSNQGCPEVINKRERIHHENEVCEFRRVLRWKDIEEVRASLDAIKIDQADVKLTLAKVMVNQVALIANVSDIQDQIKQVVRTLTTLQNTSLLRGSLSPRDDRTLSPHQSACHASFSEHDSLPRQDIVIVAGRECPGRQLRSAETFSWTRRTWTQLPSMRQPRSTPSSFVLGSCVVVAGGYTGSDGTDEMEVINFDQIPFQWTAFPARLPDKLSGQRNVVCGNHLLVISGDNWDEHRFSDAIYEVLLSSSSSTRVLCRIQQGRKNHGTEHVGDKVFILGGKTTAASKHATNSVVVYHFVKNECKAMPPLPYAVWGMSTVRWRNKIIVIGGSDQKNQVLNDVIMYDIETGGSEWLPSMKRKRLGCSAVITGNVVVVLGGYDGKEYLSSVESFSFDSNSWQQMPPMLERRAWAIAELKPGNSE